MAAGLDRSDLAVDPVTQFDRWFAEVRAAGVYQPEGVVLATADASGSPSARMVLLRGADERGFVFFTNEQSAKGIDLLTNPRAELCFGWDEVWRQVRVHGTVERTSAQESDDYWATRPRGSQLSSAASPQSRVIEDRDALEAALDELTERYGDGPVPRPSHWGGFRVRPETVEFWQGKAFRMHDRFRYRRSAGGGWVIERLAP